MHIPLVWKVARYVPRGDHFTYVSVHLGRVWISTASGLLLEKMVT